MIELQHKLKFYYQCANCEVNNKFHMKQNTLHYNELIATWKLDSGHTIVIKLCF